VVHQTVPHGAPGRPRMAGIPPLLLRVAHPRMHGRLGAQPLLEPVRRLAAWRAVILLVSGVVYAGPDRP